MLGKPFERLKAATTRLGADPVTTALSALSRTLRDSSRAMELATVPNPEPLRAGLPRVALRDLVRARARAPAPRIDVPHGAQFLDGSFANEAGSRPYKLYVPASYRAGQHLPLLVMLHGCTQSPDDFALGTRMNALAEELGLLVAYPGQTSAANMNKCWNWFQPADQRRGTGEPSLIAGITRLVMDQYGIDTQRVFIAGLSAGGAAAAVMGAVYPDLFASIGVHSGLAYGAAHDMQSAFTAMRQGASGASVPPPLRPVRAIVFHGDRDTTVHCRNGHAVAAQVAAGSHLATRVEDGQRAGRGYTRTTHADRAGRALVEQWSIHGAGHAWSGGSPAGSYTDPQGPDASREMIRFFLDRG